jgi:trehalose-6-phosphatase
MPNENPGQSEVAAGQNKTFSIAVHYRRSREKKKARAAILAAAAKLGPIRVIGGKQVVNLLPAACQGDRSQRRDQAAP